MSQIEINKDEVNAAISEFESAISTYESALRAYANVASNLDGQNSDFVNQMKSMVSKLAEDNSEEIGNALLGYKNKVKAVVDGFDEKDVSMANELSKQ